MKSLLSMENLDIHQHFHYDHTNQESIIERAQLIKGKTLSYVANNSPYPQEMLNTANKGQVGNFIEKHWFGIENNSRSEPDFKEAGIELKVSPIKEKGQNSLVVKERTKICKINYKKLVEEDWKNSHAKNKLNKILFIFYKFNRDNWNEQKILDFKLWNLSSEELVISNEWFKTRDQVQDGDANDLSEGNYKVLAPCTSGTGRLEPQPNQDYKDAPERSFALKQPFVNFLWNSLDVSMDYESTKATLDLSLHDESFDAQVLSKINNFSGKTIGDIVNTFSISIPKGKAAMRSIIMKLLGFQNSQSRIKEFEQSGIEIKVIPINAESKSLYESISFPAIKFKEFADEIWEDSTLSLQISRILFIPVGRNQRFVNINNRVLEKAFFWSPSDKELEIIKKEWSNYQKIVKEGVSIEKIPMNTKKGFKEVTSLPNESSTKIIHLRTHAQGSNDRDVDSFGTSIVKHSFWLNKKFVKKLIQNSLNS